MGTAKEALEILKALLTLEYHNKNYLAQGLCDSPARMNEIQIELVSCAIAALEEKGETEMIKQLKDLHEKMCKDMEYRVLDKKAAEAAGNTSSFWAGYLCAMESQAKEISFLIRFYEEKENMK